MVEAVGLHPGRRDPRPVTRTSSAAASGSGSASPRRWRTGPKLILADEPVSMLDVSIRIGLLNVMADLRDERGRVVPLHHPRHRQRPVRRRPADGDVRRPHRGVGPDRGRAGRARSTRTPSCCCRRCPTRGAAGGGRGGRPRRTAEGDRPEPGCRFRWRCPLAIDDCATQMPELEPVGAGHNAACHVATRASATQRPDGDSVVAARRHIRVTAAPEKLTSQSIFGSLSRAPSVSRVARSLRELTHSRSLVRSAGKPTCLNRSAGRAAVGSVVIIGPTRTACSRFHTVDGRY